ncbi:MAG: NUDIX hydrolase [Nitrososphaera sp.]|jgi:ADP-ribose pyrophosphatase
MTSLKNAPSGWSVKASKKVYDNYYLTVYEDTLDLNGQDHLYIRGIRRNYSTIVPFVSDDKILVIKSYRHLVDSVQIEVPSGYIDEGENAEQAAIRELAEETGYKAERMVPVGSYTLDYSMFIQEGHIFAAYGLSREQEQQLGKMEKIDLEIMSVSQIRQLLFEGKILNAASIVALYKALDHHHRDKVTNMHSTQNL